MDSPINIASIQLPDISTVAHPVNQLYKQLAGDVNFRFLTLKFFTSMFVNGYTINDFQGILNDNSLRYGYFAESIPTMTTDLADSYIVYYLQLIDLIKDKYESYKSQAQIIKQITTGLPAIMSVDLETHYTGWYIVIY